MVIKSADMKSETREAMRGGPGHAGLLHIVGADNLPTKSRLFTLMTLEKNCGIGPHVHAEETEIYYVLAGEGVLNDNGVVKTLAKGDANVCGGGATHAITNEKDEPLVVLAVIIKD